MNSLFFPGSHFVYLTVEVRKTCGSCWNSSKLNILNPRSCHEAGLFFLQSSRHKKISKEKNCFFFHQLKNKNLTASKNFCCLFVCPFADLILRLAKRIQKGFFFNQPKSLQCRSFRKVFRSTGLKETKPQSFEFLNGLFTGHIFVFFWTD